MDESPGARQPVAPRPGPPQSAPPPSAPPRPGPRPSPEADVDAESFGRVAADGTVYVRRRDGAERVVGQWPDGDPAEALALYIRRFRGLAIEVDLLDRRVREKALSPDDADSRIGQVRDQVNDAQAVGDLEALVERLDALAPVLAEQREQRRAARVAKLDEARSAKERLVAEAEKLAGSNDWRVGADRMRTLLDDWKAQPRIDKASDDSLWRRFSAARSTYTRRRRQHFAELHESHDLARTVKEKLAAEAETLADSTDWGATSRQFRELMQQWKAAGPAGRKEEDALWQRFRAAQDTFFGARDADRAKTEAGLVANAETKLALLAEAEKLVPVTDPPAARSALRSLSERWEAAGQAPRDQTRELEGRLRAVETAVREAEQDRWERSNPEARARAAATVAQLESLLVELREEAAAAEAAGDAKRQARAEEAIEARTSWLEQARNALADFTP